MFNVGFKGSSTTERLYLLACLIISVTYSLIIFSSPMPKSFGLIEYVMGFGLSFGSIILIYLIVLQRTQIEMKSIIVVIFVSYLLLVPLAIGLINKNHVSDIIRDIVPLLFFIVLPALFVYSANNSVVNKGCKILIITVLLVGVISTLQFFHGINKIYGSPSGLVRAMTQGLADYKKESIKSQNQESRIVDTGMSTAKQDQFDDKQTLVLLKLYEPSVMFAAVFFLTTAIKELLSIRGQILYGMLSLIIGGLCSYAILVLGLRSYTALIILVITIYSFWLLISRKNVFFKLITFIGVSVLFLYPHIKDALGMLLLKQQAVGSNGKIEELKAIINTIFQSTLSLLFGVGWGGVFENPILKIETRFSHSLISFYLLKTGIVGLSVLILLLLRTFMLVGGLQRVKLSDDKLILLIASVSALLPGIFFEPTYKMLGYGLIISLLLMNLFPLEREFT